MDIIQEIENGIVTVTYIRTLNIDEPLARMEADGTIRYYHADALGSIIALTDDFGQVKTQYNYSPFGETEIIGEPSDNPFQYTGRENDNTGLYYYRARYYSPRLKRFIAEDSILRPMLFKNIIVKFIEPFESVLIYNLYLYTFDNPINNIDLYGFAPCEARKKCIENAVKIRKICTGVSWGGQIICTILCLGTQEMFPVCAVYCHRNFGNVRKICWMMFIGLLHNCYRINCDNCG